MNTLNASASFDPLTAAKRERFDSGSNDEVAGWRALLRSIPTG